MTDKRPLSDTELDAIFAAGRRAGPQASAELMSRIVADAEGERAARPAVAAASPRRGFWRELLAQIGGWPAAAGLAAATVAGLAVGLWQPASLADLSAGYLSASTGYQIEDLMPSYGDLLGDG